MVNIDSQGHVVTTDGGNFKINGVAQEVRMRPPLKLPVICEEETQIQEIQTLNKKRSIKCENCRITLF